MIYLASVLTGAVMRIAGAGATRIYGLFLPTA